MNSIHKYGFIALALVAQVFAINISAKAVYFDNQTGQSEDTTAAYSEEPVSYRSSSRVARRRVNANRGGCGLNFCGIDWNFCGSCNDRNNVVYENE